MKRNLPVALILIGLSGFSHAAQAGFFEFSFGASFRRSTYSAESFTWTRTLGTSIGYYFTQQSGLEVGYQDERERTRIGENNSNTLLQDRVISLSWIQTLTGRDKPVQPYFKLGAGQLIREVESEAASAGLVPAKIMSLTVVGGAGIKVRIFQRLALRFEATTYLEGGKIASWDDNYAITGGISLFL